MGQEYRPPSPWTWAVTAWSVGLTMQPADGQREAMAATRERRTFAMAATRERRTFVDGHPRSSVEGAAPGDLRLTLGCQAVPAREVSGSRTRLPSGPPTEVDYRMFTDADALAVSTPPRDSR